MEADAYPENPAHPAEAPVFHRSSPSSTAVHHGDGGILAIVARYK